MGLMMLGLNVHVRAGSIRYKYTIWPNYLNGIEKYDANE